MEKIRKISERMRSRGNPETPGTSGITTNRKKGMIITACLVLVFILIAVRVCWPMLGLVRSPEDFKEYISEKGAAGAVSFYLIMVLQTMTLIIPGGPFEIAAGTAFGTVRGTLICDAAIVCGNMSAFLLSRKFGLRYVSLFVDEKKIRQSNFGKMTPRKKMISALIFLIPGLPKDQATYLLGLSDLPAVEFLMMSALLRLPTILIQVLSGDALYQGKKGITVALILVSLVLMGAGAFGYSLYQKKKKQREGKSDDAGEK